MKNKKELITLLEEIIQQINVQPSYFSNEELLQEYLEQIESNDYNSMIEYLKFKKVNVELLLQLIRA
jgi:hypothetical protein